MPTTNPPTWLTEAQAVIDFCAATDRDAVAELLLLLHFVRSANTLDLQHASQLMALGVDVRGTLHFIGHGLSDLGRVYIDPRAFVDMLIRRWALNYDGTAWAKLEAGRG